MSWVEQLEDAAKMRDIDVLFRMGFFSVTFARNMPCHLIGYKCDSSVPLSEFDKFQKTATCGEGILAYNSKYVNAYLCEKRDPL
jgi:hypothetical protein